MSGAERSKSHAGMQETTGQASRTRSGRGCLRAMSACLSARTHHDNPYLWFQNSTAVISLTLNPFKARHTEPRLGRLRERNSVRRSHRSHRSSSAQKGADAERWGSSSNHESRWEVDAFSPYIIFLSSSSLFSTLLVCSLSVSDFCSPVHASTATPTPHSSGCATFPLLYLKILSLFDINHQKQF